MSEETRHESETEFEERCRDKEDWHKHHHKHHKGGWQGGPMMGGPIWLIGWLFTIGYLQIPFFWKGVLALIIWPYYLGLSLTRLPM